ncbi:MAG: GAF domain-containing protein [Armatimonadetes bacterium]|nr:GAF domain-containing protein [Armatimonadota bacterium]
MAEADMQKLHERIRQLERQLAAAHRIAEELSRETDVDSIVRRSLEVALEAVGADAGSILLYDPAQDKLVFRYVVGGSGEALIGVAIEPSVGIAGRVFRTGATYVSEDVQADPDHLSVMVADSDRYTTRNMVTCPLIASPGEVIGVMQVLNKRGGEFNADDVALLEVLAHQIASRIQTARLQEQARAAEIVKYVGNITHDIKNMLTPVQTGALTLQEALAADAETLARVEEDPGLPDNVRSEVQAVRTDLSELAPEIISMIIDGASDIQQRMAEISNAVKGMVAKPEFALQDVRAIAARVVAALNVYAESRGVSVELIADEDLPPAEVDARQIYNAIYNLAYNAVEACENGGRVTIRLTARPSGAFPEGNCLCVEVADTGVGMPEEVRRKLFTDQAVSTKPTGTGLGTRIVKNVVDAHGGTIQVESEVGRGTVIRFRVPLRRTAQ